MNQELITVRAFRFGAFELDPRARELRKGGLRVKLEGKPLQVLELLLERPGELVTRKELRERLWPDSFVDFDRGINTAMNMLRKTLGDTPDNPRYIETRSRLGYRFVAAVGAVDVTTQPGLGSMPLDAIDATPAGSCHGVFRAPALECGSLWLGCRLAAKGCRGGSVGGTHLPGDLLGFCRAAETWRGLSVDFAVVVGQVAEPNRRRLAQSKGLANRFSAEA
ncbi:MAG: winged helix-turn-helix domain-containing protein [Terriglobia bacterium]